MIRVLLAVTAVAGVAGLGSVVTSSRSPAPGGAAATAAYGPPVVAAAGVSYRPPVVGPVRVLRGFDPPAAPYGPGHLGVDLSLRQGGAVLAAAPGVISFAGAVAGRGVVVIAHPDGIRTEYEPVTPLVRRGAAVVAGTPIGLLKGTHPGCPDSGCLHWGARRGDVYLDPLTLLRPLAPVRLLPWRR